MLFSLSPDPATTPGELPTTFVEQEGAYEFQDLLWVEIQHSRSTDSDPESADQTIEWQHSTQFLLQRTKYVTGSIKMGHKLYRGFPIRKEDSRCKWCSQQLEVNAAVNSPLL